MPADPPTAPKECVRTTTQKRPFAHIEERSFPCLWAHCRHTSTTPFALDASPPLPTSTKHQLTLPPATATPPQYPPHAASTARPGPQPAASGRAARAAPPALPLLRLPRDVPGGQRPLVPPLDAHGEAPLPVRRVQAPLRQLLWHGGVGHEGWHDVLRLRPAEEHARHMKALMEKMRREGVLVDALEEKVVEEEEEEEEEEEGFTTETEVGCEEEEEEEEEEEGEGGAEGAEVLEGEKPSDDSKTAQKEQDN